MTPRTKAEVFIQTLEEIYEYECKRKKARLRLQVKAHVKRFVEAFRSDQDGRRNASESTPQGRQLARHAGRQLRDD